MEFTNFNGKIVLFLLIMTVFASYALLLASAESQRRYQDSSDLHRRLSDRRSDLSDLTIRRDTVSPQQRTLERREFSTGKDALKTERRIVERFERTQIQDRRVVRDESRLERDNELQRERFTREIDSDRRDRFVNDNKRDQFIRSTEDQRIRLTRDVENRRDDINDEDFRRTRGNDDLIREETRRERSVERRENRLSGREDLKDRRNEDRAEPRLVRNEIDRRRDTRESEVRRENGRREQITRVDEIEDRRSEQFKEQRDQTRAEPAIREKIELRLNKETDRVDRADRIDRIDRIVIGNKEIDPETENESQNKCSAILGQMVTMIVTMVLIKPSKSNIGKLRSLFFDKLTV